MDNRNVRPEDMERITTSALAKAFIEDQIEYIKAKGGLLVLNSDSHSVKTLAFRFDDFKDLI